LLRGENADKTIEIESQDVDDEPELLADRINVVLRELEIHNPGILERVVMMETPLTYDNDRDVEDAHHIKFYPVN